MTSPPAADAAVRRARRLAGLVAVAVLLADQVSKAFLIDLLAETPGGWIEVTGFFNLVMVWNRGVSFGMFGDGAMPPWVWIALSVAIVVVLLLWIRRLDRLWTAVALGGIVGGAAGNVIDRLRFGAVADFFDLHLAGWHWPAFNIADAGIVVGVGMLLLDALTTRETKGHHGRE